MALQVLGSSLTRTLVLGLGLLTTPSKTWTLRSVMPLRVRVLGVEDDLRTPPVHSLEEVARFQFLKDGR
jgi:hypothetical protein